jgi:hypothetical protein
MGNGKAEETSIQISINPPWWKTTYAFIAYLILFIVVSWYAMRIVFKVNSFRNELRVEKAVNEVKLQFFYQYFARNQDSAYLNFGAN